MSSPGRSWRAVAIAVTLILGVSSCNTDSGGSSGDDQSTGAARRGGTLNMLGHGDVDYMDPNLSYYSIGYLAQRLWSRQLYAYLADEQRNTEPVPDLATGPARVSADGLTFRVNIRAGAQWNTEPARQVTAVDVIRGVKRTCNPAQPYGGLPNFRDLIAGFGAFCDGFGRVRPEAGAIAQYLNSTPVSGVRVGENPLMVIFTLTRPASYFPSMLVLPAFSPAPEEYDAYVPASFELGQHTIANGPYRIDSYDPTRSIVLSRNPAWKSETDAVRAAYVDKIVIDQTVTQESTQQQLQAGTARADMGFDNAPPPSQLPSLMNARDPQVHLGPTASSIPLLVFNLRSPNNGGVMKDVPFRRALMHAINRDHLIQDNGGPTVNPPLTQVLPRVIRGGETPVDLYPYDVEKAKSLLSEAGTSGPVTLKVLYDSKIEGSKKNFATVQQDLKQVGIEVTGVPAPSAAMYTQYLTVPSVAERGAWDVAFSGWQPDWFGDAALSYFKPLFGGVSSFPPNGSNFGYYSSAVTNDLIARATRATSEDEAAGLWHKADIEVMKDAVFYPVSSPQQANYRAKHVYNAQYIPAIQNFDPANVWLDPAVNGG
jgi:peptide/nickel transport system substrate-binding protein